MSKLIQRSFYNALGTVAYITIIAAVMTSLEKYASDKPDGFFAPVLFLTLFVLSAAITGSLVLGQPIVMYLAGQKQDAVKMFIYTLGWLAVALVILLAVNLR